MVSLAGPGMFYLPIRIRICREYIPMFLDCMSQLSVHVTWLHTHAGMQSRNIRLYLWHILISDQHKRSCPAIEPGQHWICLLFDIKSLPEQMLPYFQLTCEQFFLWNFNETEEFLSRKCNENGLKMVAILSQPQLVNKLWKVNQQGESSATLITNRDWD